MVTCHGMSAGSRPLTPARYTSAWSSSGRSPPTPCAASIGTPQQPHIRDRTGFAGTPTTAGQVLDWFRRANVEALCCTHTGLPYAQDFRHPAGRYLVANNGCAGLPDFAGRHHGVLTRLSVLPDVPGDSLYGLAMAGLRFDALPVEYDHSRWINQFLGAWPPGSPACRNYHHRIEHGTWLTPGQGSVNLKV
jgi:hypothetical protein